MSQTTDADPKDGTIDGIHVNYATAADTGDMIRELEKRTLHEQDIIELFKLIGTKIVHDLD